jgi:pSer/pThr/pTyr-binding forkhead associated (FHA) protein
MPASAPYAPPADAAPAPAPVLELDGRRIPLTRAVTVLGRSGDVDVPLDDAGVSRRHAEVHVTGGRFRVVDLGSTNGTFVDGERVTTGDLRDGSTITVGRSRLVFRLGQR